MEIYNTNYRLVMTHENDRITHPVYTDKLVEVYNVFKSVGSNLFIVKCLIGEMGLANKAITPIIMSKKENRCIGQIKIEG